MGISTRTKVALACSALFSLIGAGCGSSSQLSQPETQATSVETDANEDAASGETDPTPTSDPTSTTEQATSTAGAETSAATPHRVAPVGSDMAVMRWISNRGVWTPSHTNEWNEHQLGRIVEIAEAAYGWLVFQREVEESVIWALTDSGPQELIVADEYQALTLEGAGANSEGEPIVFYQRRERGGSPETARTTLRTYNIETGEVTEIMESGWWETGTHFNHIQTESLAVAFTQSEGWSGNAIADLSAPAQQVWTYEDEGCPQGGGPDCVVYEHATFVGDRSVGVRPVWSDDARWIDQVGLFEFDLQAGTERLIAAFPWDNGLWYVEDMFALDSDSVVLSLSGRHDASGDPLPALVVSVETGEAFTLPEAGFVRPVT